ncbi:CHAT domain-containing protein [Curtobacterium sp. 24E2]|nr:CHAT domain-containing protein [Curtobacterium sp. 24E2]
MSPSVLPKMPGLEAMPPISRALVAMLVGQGHLLGVDNEDLTFGGEVSADEVRRLIDLWRSGRVAPEIVAEPVMATVSLIWAAVRWESFGKTALHAFLLRSHLLRRLEEALGDGLLDDRDYHTGIESNPPSLLRDSAWPEALRAVATGEPADLRIASPLELRLILDDPFRDWQVDRLLEVRRVTYASLTADGAWPAKSGGTVPPWLRDVVAGDGARFWHNSTGFVPTFHLVLESPRDEADFLRWTYRPAFSMEFLSDNRVVVYIVLDPEGDAATLPFYFSYEDWQSSEQLDLFAAIGLLRIEVYRIEADGVIKHLYNFGTTTDWVLPILQHRGRWGGKPNHPLSESLTPEELMKAIDQRQRAAFETTVPGLDPRSANDGVREAWERRLKVLDRAADTYSVGGIVDIEVLEETVIELRNAESRSREPHDDDFGAEIAPGEAVVHYGFREDLGWFSVAAVHRSEDGAYSGQFYDTTEAWREDSFASGIDDLVRPLVPLQAEGVKHLTVSAGAGAYALPLHDAALRLGFETVSYSHSLRRRPASGRGDGVLVMGYSGAGRDHIPAVDAELSYVSSLYNAAVNVEPEAWRGNWPGVVHVAGHGVTGMREYEAGIYLQGSFMSASGVLRSVDASDTGLAFLSACDSGAGEFAIGAIGKSVPLDVALLERGCSTVVSTSAPVNDVVASVFAVAFHASYAAGASAWDAYSAARAIFEAGRKDVTRELKDVFERYLPNWQTELSAEAEATWRFFRFSGLRG